MAKIKNYNRDLYCQSNYSQYILKARYLRALMKLENGNPRQNFHGWYYGQTYASKTWAMIL
jgi:hypothetical protein